MRNVPINTNASGNTQLVAAPAAPGFIRVHGYHLTSNGAVTVQFQDDTGFVYDTCYGTTVAGGGIAMPANSGADGESKVFDVAAGHALLINLSTGQFVGGGLLYSVLGAGGGTTGI